MKNIYSEAALYIANMSAKDNSKLRRVKTVYKHATGHTKYHAIMTEIKHILIQTKLIKNRRNGKVN